jgi:hypothetical protein
MLNEEKEVGDELVNDSFCIKLKNKIKVREKAKKENVSKSKIVDKLIEDSQ